MPWRPPHKARTASAPTGERNRTGGAGEGGGGLAFRRHPLVHGAGDEPADVGGNGEAG
ncbi:hypothetical protein RMHFA_05674 [Roseomonas mucosa]|nr:hypothetical protein RMHFA_05674 [Roseomonas mucosa]